MTSYLPNGKMSRFKNNDINQKGDTTLTELVKFTYNAQHQLLTGLIKPMVKLLFSETISMPTEI